MAILSTQKNIHLQLTTDLGEDKLIIEELTVDEYLHDLFELKIIAHSNDIDIDLNQALGQTMTVCLDINSSKRYFHGVVSRFEHIHTSVLDQKKKLVAFYHIHLVPQLWLLKHSKDYRIFQNKSAQDIIKEIMDDNKITSYVFDSQKGTAKRDFCVQYNESHFDFVVRLCEEEGMFYRFKHSESDHKLHFVDATVVPDSMEGDKEFPYALKMPSTAQYNTVYKLVMSEHVKGTGWKTLDYNYLKPSVPLSGEATAKGVGGTFYTYPALFSEKADGDTRAKDLLASHTFGAKTVMGESTIPALEPFHSFNIIDHPRESLNTEYVIYRVRHRIAQTQLQDETHGIAYERAYDNQFWAYPADTECKPPITQHKPRIHSLQTATVTGPAGEEIYSDEHARVKVKFHWDSRNKADDKSSCWIRVAQNWAGSKWGGLVLPRIGMEVVISFMDGDPDRPLIMGCVYNGEHLPPYDATDNTISTFKSQSSKAEEGFNELRFEDKKGSEEIYIHAQKDMNVVIENERTEEIVEKDDTLTIKKGDKTEKLEGSGTKYKVDITDGDRELTITKGNHKITLMEGNQEFTLTKGDQTVTLNKGDSAMTLTSGDAKITLASGDLTITVTGNTKIIGTGDMNLEAGGKLIMQGGGGVMITSGANMACQVAGNCAIQAGGNIPVSAGGNMVVAASANATFGAGGNLLLNGGGNAILKGGGNIAMDAGAIFQIKGAAINATAQGAANIMASGAATLKGAIVTLG